MKRNWTITDAIPADAEALHEMHAQSWRETYPSPENGVSLEWVNDRIANHWSIQKRRQNIKDQSKQPDVLQKVAKDPHGKIVGYIHPWRDSDNQRVGAIYIAKEYYGTGLASELMNIIIEWFDASRPAELEVADYNERAKAFYRKFGFEEVVGSQRTHHVIPVVKMVRKGKDTV